MIICPNCKHEEMDGALFCSECGAQLVSSDASAKTHSIQKDPTMPFSKPATDPLRRFTSTNAWATLYLLDNGQILPLTDRREYTLGRASEGQPIMPDIDLSPHKAYEHGVSRLHAVIKKQNNRIIIMDLGSSNGTYLNGVRLMPNIENPLVNGDMIALGKMKMQILLNQSGS
jgi:FHA domain-containing protein